MITDAFWIGNNGAFNDACPEFIKSFKIPKKIKYAELRITAIGAYEAYINDERIGDFIFAPGCTDYKNRLQYQVYEISEILKEENIIAVVVGKGWYRGRISEGNKEINSTPCAIIAEIDILYCDGTVETLITDESWKVRRSNIISSDFYDGEIYDASYIDNRIYSVEILNLNKKTLILQEGDIVCEHERLNPVSVFISPKGEKIIDFGQNLVGYVELCLDADNGDLVEISHAEVLDQYGNFYTENYRSAKAKLKYVCKEGKQTYKPHFTYMGFRYIRIDKYPNNFELNDFTAITVYSDMKRTGYIECSNEKVNRLFENVLWSQRGNFIDFPTDCPQRDERMGWTGDAQVFAKTACYNYNVNRFFAKWLADVRSEQLENGEITDTVPNFWCGKESSAGWGDAICIIPWQIYLTYGDKKILEDNFDSMKKWVDYITNDTKEEFLWISSYDSKLHGGVGKHFGDWLALDAPSGTYKGSSDDNLIASAFYANSTHLLIKVGQILGKDMSKYENLYNNILKTFKNRYNNPKTQTEHALLLNFDLTDNKYEVASNLNDMILKNGNKMQTGFIGTPYLLHVLTDNGYSETAYNLLLQEDYPSWLYEVNHGATTIWEHWDGINDSGDFWNSEMNSYNHYAYGAVVDWIYEKAAGIQADESNPGFKQIIISPNPDKRLNYLTATLETKYGKICSSWKYDKNNLVYNISVPTDALIIIDDKQYSVTKGKYTFE